MKNRRMEIRVASKFLEASRSNNDFQAHLENALSRYLGFVIENTKARSKKSKFYLLAFRDRDDYKIKIHVREKLQNRTLGFLIATLNIQGKVDIELNSTFGGVYTDSTSNMNMTAGELATYLKNFIENNLEETYYVDPKDIRLAKKRNAKNSFKPSI